MQTRPYLLHVPLRGRRQVRLRKGDDLSIDVVNQVGGMQEIVAEGEAAAGSIRRGTHADRTAWRRAARSRFSGIVRLYKGPHWYDDFGSRGAAESEFKACGGVGLTARHIKIPIGGSFRAEKLLEDIKHARWEVRCFGARVEEDVRWERLVAQIFQVNFAVAGGGGRSERCACDGKFSLYSFSGFNDHWHRDKGPSVE